MWRRRRWEKGVQRRWRYVLEQSANLRILGVGLVVTSLFLFVYQGWLSSPPADVPPARSPEDNNLLRGFPPEPKAVVVSRDANDVDWWAVLPESSPKHQFVVCTKVGNEVSYLLEWIEFHRAQGIDRFALYADDSVASPRSQTTSQQIALIVSAYKEMGFDDLIDLYSVSSFLGEVQFELMDPQVANHTTTEMHRLSQQSLLKHCKETYQHLSEWIVHIDVDEFLHAPRHDSLSDFFRSLYDLSVDTSLSESFAANYLVGNLSGIYVWPVSYGLSSGRLLDHRVALRASPISGSVEIMFDPRATQNSFAKLLSRLKEETGKEEQAPDVADVFRKLLTDDLNPYAARDLFIGPEDVLRLSTKVTNLYKRAAAESENGGENRGLRFAREVEEAFAEMRAEAFPLVIDEQRRRMPSLDYGDDFETVAAAMVEMHPECKEYIDILLRPENAQLRSKIGAEDRIKRIGDAPFPFCVPGDLPNGLTNLGKSLLWTGHRFEPPRGFAVPQAYSQKGELSDINEMNRFSRNHRQRRNPRLGTEHEQRTQCLQPWVHICSHKTWAPYISAVVATQLRLDHHMLRSLESRTIADAKWRSGGWGKFMVDNTELDFSPAEFTTLVQDDAKAKYVPRIREALRKVNLKMIPAQVHLPAGSRQLRTTWYTGDCDLGKLVLRQQHMCPADFPNVGFFDHAVTPPYALMPLGWCTNQTDPKLAKGTLQRYANVDDFDPDCAEVGRCKQVKREISDDFDLPDIAMCPGMPRTDCCDYSASQVRHVETFLKAFGAFDAYNVTINRPLQLKEWWRPSIYNYIGQD